MNIVEPMAKQSRLDVPGLHFLISLYEVCHMSPYESKDQLMFMEVL